MAAQMPDNRKPSEKIFAPWVLLAFTEWHINTSFINVWKSTKIQYLC